MLGKDGAGGEAAEAHLEHQTGLGLDGVCAVHIPLDGEMQDRHQLFTGQQAEHDDRAARLVGFCNAHHRMHGYFNMHSKAIAMSKQKEHSGCTSGGVYVPCIYSHAT